MIQRIARPVTPAELYELDETAWLEETARLVAAGQWKAVDAAHLACFLSDIAKRDKREVLSRLTVLLAHMLKVEHQPRKKTKSWQATIATQRDELSDLLESASLRQYAEEVLTKAYKRAARQAALETGLRLESFAADCPYQLEQVLGGE